MFLSLNVTCTSLHTLSGEANDQSVGLQVQIASGCHSFIALTAKKH